MKRLAMGGRETFGKVFMPRKKAMEPVRERILSDNGKSYRQQKISTDAQWKKHYNSGTPVDGNKVDNKITGKKSRDKVTVLHRSYM